MAISPVSSHQLITFPVALELRTPHITIALLVNRRISLRKTTITFVALWALTSLYIALFPTRHYTADAVNNLLFIEQQNRFELWHTQHLLAQWPGYWTYQLAGGTLRAWEAMRIAHALLAGATVSLVYTAALVLTRSYRI